MTFPTSPYDGQSATVNSVAYTYNATANAWTRVKANTSFIDVVTGQSIYNQANGAFSQANAATSSATFAYANANASYIQANAAFNQANSATNSATYGYFNANQGFIQANSAFTAVYNIISGVTTLSYLKLAAGGSTVGQSPLKFTSGTVLATPEAGAAEYDGNFLYFTPSTTSGKGLVPNDNYYVLTSDASAVGATIANFFPGTSSIPLISNGIYEIEYDLYFTKTTAGTLVWTLVNSTTVTKMHAKFEMSPITGVTSTAAASYLLADVANQTTASVAFAATGSLTTAVNHHAKFKILLVNGASTSFRLQVTNSAGTVTPLAGSNWRARRIANTGTYLA